MRPRSGERHHQARPAGGGRLAPPTLEAPQPDFGAGGRPTQLPDPDRGRRLADDQRRRPDGITPEQAPGRLEPLVGGLEFAEPERGLGALLVDGGEGLGRHGPQAPTGHDGLPVEAGRLDVGVDHHRPVSRLAGELSMPCPSAVPRSSGTRGR